MKKELLVGLVFLVALGLAIFGTVMVSGLSIFTPTTDWHVTIKNIAGLQTGDEVRVMGYRMGTVRKITFDGDKNEFRMRLVMDARTPIREGYEISVRELSALGGKYLAVDPGTPGKPKADVKNLVAVPGPINAMASVQDVLGGLDKTVQAINRKEGTIGKLIYDDDVYRNLQNSADSLQKITERIEAGQGTLGKLVNDPALYDQVNELATRLNTGNSALARLFRDESGSIVEDLQTTAANVRSITAKIDQGRGTVGKLVNDPILYDNANTTLSNLTDIIRDAREGKGVLGMLVSNDKARENVEKTLDNVQILTTKLRDGQGSLGKLLTDNSLYDRANSAAEHLDNATAKIDNGAGTLGKLINDPEVYDKAKRLLTRAIDTIENTRDSAPVSAITSFIFGPFQ